MSDRASKAAQDAANQAIISFAAALCVETDDDCNGKLMVPLDGALRGCRLTWGHNDPSARLFFCVVTQEGSALSHGHETPEAAVAAAGERVRPKPRDVPAVAAKPAAECAPLPIPQRSTGRAQAWVYICHPYSNDPAGNAARVAAICRCIVAEGMMPIAPQVYLPAFVDDATERETAMALCLGLMFWCDEVRVYGPTLTAGMLEELRFAMAQGMRIVHVAGDDHP
jgi:hypothetical protein